MRRLVLPLALLLAALPAHADVIPVTFEATITDVDALLAAGFTVGETVTGSFLLDTEATDLEPVPDEGRYAAISDFTADFGGFAVTGVEMFLNVRNGEGFMVDSFFPNGEVTGADVGGLSPESFFLNLGDSENTVFSSEAIPATLDLAEFETKNLSLSFSDGKANASIDGAVTELTYGVPEPSGALLTFAGALALAARARLPRRAC